MAHELVHLLLRSTEHGVGVTALNFTPANIKRMSDNPLQFTPNQSPELRGKVRRER